MKLATIAPGRPFLDGIAQRWVETWGLGRDAGGAGLILVPGRRAARALMEAFLRCLDGEAALLPRIVPIGDIEDEVAAFADHAALDLVPAVDPVLRLSVLAMLVLKADGAFSTAPTVDQAWPLARALAELMDDAERAGVDLAVALPDAADERFAEHWSQTLTFLKIVTEAWPLWLAGQGLSNPVARAVKVLKIQARLWQERPPEEPVWAVGFTDDLGGVGELLKAVASVPSGQVVLPGVDLSLSEALWDVLPDSHPQAAPRRLLHAMGATRGDLVVWETQARRAVPASRIELASLAMLPAEGLAAWGQRHEPIALDGLWRIEATDQQQEAAAIAMILRDGIRKSGRDVALVTPDRGLARRVATELLRFGVVADDSAGEALSLTPPAVFLRLLAEAAATGLSPVALLALLKHPLTALGMTPGNCRASARRLERAVLRGPAPQPGIEGLRAALGTRHRSVDRPGSETADRPDQPEELETFLTRLSEALAPLAECGRATLPELLTALVRAAENLACVIESDGTEHDGADRLWSGAEGHALSRLVGGLIAHTGLLPDQDITQLPGFLLSAFAGEMVFGQRVLQGRDGEAVHRRVSILGVLEARLVSVDLLVLGGLNEGIWPPASDPGPWMSRPMRRRIGLPSPERQIGVAAHDFVTAMFCAPDVVLSNPARREGAPAVPARWLVRLQALLGGQGQKIAPHPAMFWQGQLDQPGGPPSPVQPPAPRPPVRLRPRRMAVTEIETWLRDPYAIYARHVLGLSALPALEESADRSDIGMIVHDGLDRWLRRGVLDSAHLQSDFEGAMSERKLRVALEAWWRPRLQRIAEWVSEQESRRARPVHLATEARGKLVVTAEAGAFSLIARADRIEIDAEGMATIIDYKTGTLPALKDVLSGWSAQLVLEAAMLGQGAFAPVPAARAVALLYWRLTGDRDRGEERAVGGEGEALAELVDEALVKLRRRIDIFDRPETPYLSHPHPDHEPRFTDYALLARVPEWSVARGEADE